MITDLPLKCTDHLECPDGLPLPCGVVFAGYIQAVAAGCFFEKVEDRSGFAKVVWHPRPSSPAGG